MRLGIFPFWQSTLIFALHFYGRMNVRSIGNKLILFFSWWMLSFQEWLWHFVCDPSTWLLPRFGDNINRIAERATNQDRPQIFHRTTNSQSLLGGTRMSCVSLPPFPFPINTSDEYVGRFWITAFMRKIFIYTNSPAITSCSVEAEDTYCNHLHIVFQEIIFDKGEMLEGLNLSRLHLLLESLYLWKWTSIFTSSWFCEVVSVLGLFKVWPIVFINLTIIATLLS